MANKWRVRKRDGVWVVLDRAGKLRYAAFDYQMALSFALMVGKYGKKRKVRYLDHPWPDGTAFSDILRVVYENGTSSLENRDAIREALEQTDYEEDEQ